MDSIGKYKIIKELGAGGFGAVYLAEDPRLGEQVAIKVFRIRDENVAQQATTATGDAGEVLKGRFLNEARTLRKLQRNPHIVEVFDFDELDDGTPYYVMPYLPRSLKNELGSDATDAQVIAELDPEEKPRRLPLTQCWLYLEQLLIALKDVHKAGLIHRDIKPANLLFDEHGAVKLCDFGIAKVPDSEHSYSGIGMGSRNYMAPEQRQSAKHVDARSDIYSAGVLAYRMITGTLPEGRYADPIHYQPGLTEAQNDFILKALSQQKDDRFVDGAAMLSALRTLEGKNSSGADESTGTWVGGTDDIRPELKPLEQKIIQLLQSNGEIRTSDRPILQALADLGGLSASELEQLIVQIAEQQSSQDPQFKALSNWLATVRNKAAVTAAERTVLIEAGVLTTGKSKAELEAILDAGKVKKAASAPEKKPAPEVNPAPKSKPASDPRPASKVVDKPVPPQETKRKSPALFIVPILASVLGVGGYFFAYDVEPAKPKPKASKELFMSQLVKEWESKFSLIKGGQKQLGCSTADNDCKEVEARQVSISVEDFYMSQGEVSFAMWDSCVQAGYCSHTPGDRFWGRGDMPVINVSYEDVTGDFIPWLNKLTGNKYRLSTEQEWEFAARGKADSIYYWGNYIGKEQANCFGCGRNIKRPAVAYSYTQNDNELYNMLGNVWEMTDSCWSDQLLTKGPDTRKCGELVKRGGAWNSSPSLIKLSTRQSFAKDERSDDLGFRLVRVE